MSDDKTNTLMIITSFLQLLADQDADGISKLFADDIDWYVPGNPALAWVGPKSHRSDVASYFRTMWSNFKTGKSTTTPGKLIIDGEEAVLFAVFSHVVANTGNSFKSPVAMHLTVAGSKIVRMHLYEDTWAVSKAFFN